MGEKGIPKIATISRGTLDIVIWAQFRTRFPLLNWPIGQFKIIFGKMTIRDEGPK